MAKLKYANTEIEFTVERLVEIAQLAIDGLREDSECPDDCTNNCLTCPVRPF